VAGQGASSKTGAGAVKRVESEGTKRAEGPQQETAAEGPQQKAEGTKQKIRARGPKGGSRGPTGSSDEGDTPPALPAGRVGRAHGLDGSFYVTGPRPRLLTLGTSVTVAGRSAEIVRRAGTDRRPIVRLDGVEDREGADALRGMTLTVDRIEAPALAEGEWWAHELEGCTVVDGGRVIGTVERMIELPSCEALEVRREMIGAQPTGTHPPAPLVVPMVKDAIRRMALAERRIEIDMGFLGEADPEEQDPEEQGAEGRGAEGQGAEGQGPEGQGPDGQDTKTGEGIGQ
jgi:16S rRNA processing protein RimM